MRLLVSVKDAAEAAAARAGGADIIDAKDPASGALGAVDLVTFDQIVAEVAGTRAVTAALGDAADERAIARTADAYARAGARLVKIGFAGIASLTRVMSLLAAARDGAATHAGVIATAYADADRVASLTPFTMIDAAARSGSTGILLDTADKHGPDLTGLMSQERLSAWVRTAHDARLLVALAGKLTADDFGYVSDAGADIVGVRGAACNQGRTGEIEAEKVRELARAMLRLTFLTTGEPVE
jgi:(5-formylfuran-3-yl)methyl phosphate synthase